MTELRHELGLIALESCKELGKAVDKFIQEKRNTSESFLIPINEIRFSNGEGKVKISESVRGKDIYILCDIGNYSCTYKMFGFINHKGPDEHFQDIKRTVSAIRGKAAKITVIMPLLYESRQHRRKGRESLDCALALQELERLGVHEVLTFDVHDPNVQNAIPLLSFENFYPTSKILEELLHNEKEIVNNLLVIAPDMGAMERARFYAEMLGCDVGVFYKRRDLSKVINGKNPIVEHVYMGADIKGKDIIVVDDMISSGASMLDVSKELKVKGAGAIYLVSTFALFTEGTFLFDLAYRNGEFNRIYSTNLSYVPNDIKSKEWYYEVDCSSQIAEIIATLVEKKSLEDVHHKKMDLYRQVEKIINK